MKTLTISSILILLSASRLLAGQDVPSSRRSREAIRRASPAIRIRLAERGIEFGAPVYIRIFKEEMVLEVWLEGEDGFELFRSYPVCTCGTGGPGPKTRQGDGMAPEGFYFVTPSRMNPFSDFHLSFDLGYPNSYDRHHKRTGGALMVHGSCVSIGCYAMTDELIEEIFTLADAALRNGQPFFRVHIFPFRMDAENMKKHEGNRWYAFWSNLKEGYERFGGRGDVPPDVEVRGGRYVFGGP